MDVFDVFFLVTFFVGLAQAKDKKAYMIKTFKELVKITLIVLGVFIAIVVILGIIANM